MYRKLKQLAMAEQVQYLTKKLVQIPSINATTGEITLADYLYKIISSFPYFQKHPQALWMQEIDEDLLERKNVFALLRGGDGKEKKTIIYHAHIDTVGIDDFGALRHEAFNPDSLQHFLKRIHMILMSSAMLHQVIGSLEEGLLICKVGWLFISLICFIFQHTLKNCRGIYSCYSILMRKVST